MLRLSASLPAAAWWTLSTSLNMQASLALDNGAARTPPMGWLSWERYACITDCKNNPDNCISSKLYMDMADRMAADGWKQAGYEYVNVDDCWAAQTRDDNGLLQADETRFPGGIKKLCDYIHSKGLKCGLYTDIGATTCAGYLALNVTTDMNNEQFQRDMENFASWGIDSLKVDGCNQDVNIMNITYPRLSLALVQASRKHPIVYSCSWPAYISIPGQHIPIAVYDMLAAFCNIWRNYNDIRDTWDSVQSIMKYWHDNQDDMVAAAGPGRFNDPDMILAGNTGLSPSEYEAQFVMWSIFAAPLLMSNDLRQIDNTSKQLLQNRDIIAVNQDPLGKQGRCVSGKAGDTSVWVRPLANGDVAVALLNEIAGIPGTPRNLSITTELAGLPSEEFTVYDLLQRRMVGHDTFSKQYTALVPTNSVHFVRLSAAKSADQDLIAV